MGSNGPRFTALGRDEMNQLVSSTGLAQALGITRQAVAKNTDSWSSLSVPGRGRGGQVKYYEVASLPPIMQRRLLSHRLRNITINDLEPRHCRPESAANLHKAPEQALDLALAKARVLKLAEEVMALGKAAGLNRGSALDRWLNGFNRGLVAQRLKAKLGPLSRRSVYRWRRAFNEKGLAGLMDQRGKHPRSPTDREVRDFIEGCVLGRPGITSAKIFKLMVYKFKDRHLPAKGTVRNLVARFRKEQAALITLLHQPSAFKRHYQPSLGRADAGLTEPNQRWEADSTRADLMTADGKRCTMIVVVDVWTRRPVFGVWEKGGGDPIASTFFKAFKKLGIPGQVIVDLGKDYQSKQVQEFFFALGISAPEIPGHSPELKPHAEIAFHLVSDLLRTLTGYTGNSLVKRPEVIEIKHTLAELQELTDKWVVDFENNHTVSSISSTPRERWESALSQGWQPDVAPLEQLFLLLKPLVTRTVRQCRINYNKGLYTAEELVALAPSERVSVRPDPLDAGIIYVFDQEGDFLCVATDIDRLNLTPQQINERKKRWWSIRRAEARAARERIKALELDHLERARLDEVVSQAKPFPPLPAPNIDLPEMRAAAEARREFLDREPPGALASPEQTPEQFSPRAFDETRLLSPEASGEIEASGQIVLTPFGERIKVSARPLFTTDLQRALWIMARVRVGLNNTSADLAFLEQFKGTEMWEQLGGHQFKQYMQGQRDRIGSMEMEQ